MFSQGQLYGCYNRDNGEFIAMSKLDENSKIKIRCGFISKSSITVWIKFGFVTVWIDLIWFDWFLA